MLCDPVEATLPSTVNSRRGIADGLTSVPNEHPLVVVVEAMSAIVVRFASEPKIRLAVRVIALETTAHVVMAMDVDKDAFTPVCTCGSCRSKIEPIANVVLG